MDNKYSIEKELTEIFKSDEPNETLITFTQEKLNKCLEYVRSRTLQSEIVANSKTINNSYPDIENLREQFVELSNKFEDSKEILAIVDIESIKCKFTLKNLIERIQEEIIKPVEKLDIYFLNKEDNFKERDINSSLIKKLKNEWRTMQLILYPEEMGTLGE